MQRKGPLPGKIFTWCILQRRFAGHFGCMARISCQSQLISDAWRANLARNWRFSRPRPLSGCMERKTCHGLPSGNAPRRNLATVRPPRTRSFGIPPLPVARSRSALYAREWVQSLGCAVGFGAQRFLCKGVGIPPSLGLIAGNDFESALFRWATMSPLRVLQSCAVLCAEAKSALTFI